MLPWMHLEVMPQGTSKICCVAKEEIHEAAEQLHLSRNSFTRIRASRYMQSMRRALAAGTRVAACSYCWNDEARGTRSPRQLWNERFPEIHQRLMGQTGEALASPQPLEYLQLSLGNKCNLACRMCNASYSSRIAENPVHAAWAPAQPLRLLGVAAAPRSGWDEALPWFEQPAFLNEDLLGNAASLRHLTVTGGEPLLSDAFQGLLDELVRRGHAAAIAVRISSNLFHAEARVRRAMESLQRFRHCSVGASVDGYGSVYEYVRPPARWDVVARNLGLVNACVEGSGHVVMTLDVVVQAYNVLGLVDLLRHADGLGRDCFLHVVEQPRFLRLDVVPGALRAQAAERLKAYARAALAPGQAANRESALAVARQIESIADGPETAAVRLEFARFTRALDEFWRRRLEDAAPELAAALAAELDAARNEEPRRG